MKTPSVLQDPDRRMRLAVYLFLAFSFLFTLLLTEREANERIDQIEQTTRDEVRANCLILLNTRGVVRDIVVLATEGSAQIDYTKLPSFEGLDPEIKEFFVELTALSVAESGDNSSFRQVALSRLPLPDCDEDGVPDTPDGG